MSLAARALIVAVLAGILGTTMASPAQTQTRAARVGVMLAGGVTHRRVDELRQGLRELGWVEGENVVLEVRYAEGRDERLPGFAVELVRLGVDVIVTNGLAGIRAAQATTKTIPIVMARMGDADAHGLVASLARPGGNVTGLSFQSSELSPKFLQLLREAVPRLSRVAVLWDPAGTHQHVVRATEAAGQSSGIQIQVLEVRDPAGYPAAFEAARKAKADGLVILPSINLTAQQARLAELAIRSRLPATYYNPLFATAGGLMAYGPSESEFSFRRAAAYVDKILRGAKPADLPVEQPRRFDLVINLKTARLLGLTLPPSLLGRAEEVIQ